jgi:hypothetical protein
MLEMLPRHLALKHGDDQQRGIDSRKKIADGRANPPADGELRPAQTELLHMAEVKIDLSDIERWTKDIGGKADQIPFVMSQLINDGAFKTRQVLVNMWPNKVTVRNANFISAALQINKSDKHNLKVEIYDRSCHGFCASEPDASRPSHALYTVVRGARRGTWPVG